MPPSDLEDLRLLIDAVRDASPLALALFRRGETTVAETWRKDKDKSLVSEADFAVNDRLREIFGRARPDYGWLSEEDADSAERLARDRVFVVDPIDGTRSFVEGKPEFCISVAIIASGAPVAAVIYAPALDELYDAARDAPARLNAAPIRILDRISGPDELGRTEVLASKSSLKSMGWGATPPFNRRFVQPIAYRLCLVAAGRSDGVVAFRTTNEWDIAAGTLIAEQAGALVTDRDRASLSFNSPTARLNGVVAAAPRLHEMLTTGGEHPRGA